MNWYLTVLRKYAVFHGRASRKEFWFFFLFHFLIISALMKLALNALMGLTESDASTIPLLLYVCATAIPVLAVQVRRLHDINFNGLWFLIGGIPGGVVFLLIFYVQPSQPSENRYGPNPCDSSDPA